MPITKNDLINDTAISCGSQKETTRIVVEQFFDVVKDLMKEGNSLEIRGFGTFSVKSYSQRAGRNLKTGELIPLAPCKNMSFKFSPELKAKVAGSAKKIIAPKVAKQPALVRELAEIHSL